MDFNSIVFPAPTEDKYNELLHSEEIIFIPKTKKDGTKYHIPCLYQESTKNKDTNKLFIYFHGNAEDIFNATSNISVIRGSLPFNTVSMEYPGYSIYYDDKNAETIEDDCLTIYDFFVNKLKIKEKDIVICGRSIGTGPATFLASKRKPSALILISPIKSIRDTAKSILGFMRFMVKDRFNNYERIQNVTCPLLIIHGQKDSLIPYQDSILLTEKTGGPYELILPQHMNHNDVHIYDDFLEPITNFLKSHQMLNIKTDQKIIIPEDYYLLPDYLKDRNSLSNKDYTSQIVRKVLKI